MVVEVETMMDRRALMSTALAFSTFSLVSKKRALAWDTESFLHVRRRWDAELGSGADIDRFTTMITAYGSEEEASGAFEILLDGVDEGMIYSEETGADDRGDDAFFVRFDDPNFVIDEFTIRFGPIMYEFRSEAIHYGGARNAFRLMEEVYSRVNETADTKEELLVLLPTREEVSKYGLTKES
jgi:hypothetical protein